MSKKNYKSGFVSLVGRPNVGKSTLINKIIQSKIAIISDKPQTTRNIIRGIYQDDSTQIIFLDTPGMQSPRNKLGNFMLKASRGALEGIDVILYVSDESSFIGKNEQKALEYLSKTSVPRLLILNKMDKIDHAQLLKNISMYEKLKLFDEIIPCSAMKEDSLDYLIQMVKKYLPFGPAYYPDDAFTDQPERSLVAETIREKVMWYLQDEIPHGVMVVVDSMKVNPQNRIMGIQATLFCEREAHKKIIIGKKGRKLKGIGMAARKDLEFLVNAKVHLELWVKIKENWRDNESQIQNFGFKEE